MGSRKMTRKRRENIREETEQAEHREKVKRYYKKYKEEYQKKLITTTRHRWDWITKKKIEKYISTDWNRSGMICFGWFRDFASALKYSGSPEYRLKLSAMLLTVYEKNRELIVLASYYNYAVLASEEWLRPLITWKSRGKSERAQYRSLIDHLLVRYPVPEFIYQLVDIDFKGWNGMSLFAKIARGEKVMDCFNGGFLPISMTKRMCHVFMQMPGNTPFFEAVRRAQVEVLGGDGRIAEAICRTFLGRGTVGNEDFWVTVIRWFCQHPDVDFGQVGPLLDFIKNRRENDAEYSMKGRTVRSLMRGMEEWHKRLALEKDLHGFVFKPSGFRCGSWELLSRNGKSGKRNVWTVEEVLTSKVLLDEGTAMKHCVYSYVPDIKEGDCSIWSLKRNGVRALTVEVLKEKRVVHQAKGKCNRTPRGYELSVVRRWAKENMLRMDKGWRY